MEHGIQLSQIEKIGFSSVVPEVNFIISQFCKNFFGLEPYLISPKSYPKLPVKSLRPNEIGSDLMCNVVAAFSKHRSPVIIVDFGTALTFTAVDKKKEKSSESTSCRDYKLPSSFIFQYFQAAGSRAEPSRFCTWEKHDPRDSSRSFVRIYRFGQRNDRGN
ncbi:type III pantothenate kinase [Algoriphagus boritolerans]|uniref:type III pantothenate kinase n=1 Tax=Algoriphagus boritolerans TaxID=308111 RepID=UPI002FCE4129